MFRSIFYALLWAGIASWGLTTQGQQTALPRVVVARVVEQQVATGQRFIGTVMPDRRVTVGVAVTGRVAEYMARAGQWMQAGEPLARLHTDTLEIELAAAKAEAEFNRQALLELENGSRPEEIEEARAAVMAARAVQEAAQANLQRLRQLVASGAATASDLEAAEERANTANSQLAAAEAVFRRVVAGQREERIAQARARWELSQHQVRLIEDRIAKSTVIAPFAGVVTTEWTERGAWVTTGDPVCEMADLKTVKIEIPVPVEVAQSVRIGQTVRVEIPDAADLLATGQIERIVPVADPRARTFPVIIRVQNHIEEGLPRFLAGVMARVELPSGPPIRAPLVPKDALVLNSGRCSVFVVDSPPGGDQNDGVEVTEIPVELGVSVDDLVQVRGDLHDGQYVVVLGNERLIDGTRVRVEISESMQAGS